MNESEVGRAYDERGDDRRQTLLAPAPDLAVVTAPSLSR